MSRDAQQETKARLVARAIIGVPYCLSPAVKLDTHLLAGDDSRVELHSDHFGVSPPAMEGKGAASHSPNP